MNVTNLYERFGCENKYELLEKVKSNDPIVQDLVDFIDYAKCNIQSPFKEIVSPEVFVEYYSRSLKDSMLSDDELRCVFVNNKNIPVHHSIISLNDINEDDISNKLQENLKTTLRRGLSVGGSSVFLVRNEMMSKSKKEKVVQFFKDVELNILDEMVINDSGNSLYTLEGGYTEPIKNLLPLESNKIYEEFNLYKNYNEFSRFYAKNEISGLNLIRDNNEVLDSLKVGYQHEIQEYLGVIIYDDSNLIVSVDEMFAGGSNSAIVDYKIILKHVLEFEEAKGIAIFHNHPSGIPLNIVS